MKIQRKILFLSVLVFIFLLLPHAGKADYKQGTYLDRVSTLQETPTPLDSDTESEDQNSSENQNIMIRKFLRDPFANTIAVLTLVFMIASAIVVLIDFLSEKSTWIDRIPSWIIPLLSIIGLIVAIYLSYIELSHKEPICGPVGNCGAVQNSPYAYLFGIIPIGIIGIAGYLIILAAWIFGRFGSSNIRKIANFAVWIFAWIGILFSIYLTFLEPFVIGATCAWCITSALLMTLILWSSTGPAKAFWSED